MLELPRYTEEEGSKQLKEAGMLEWICYMRIRFPRGPKDTPFAKGVRNVSWRGSSIPMNFNMAVLCRPGLKAGEVVTEFGSLRAMGMRRPKSKRG